MRRSRAQGAFEYVLLLAGILLVAVIAVLILRGNVFPSVNSQIGNNQQAYNNIACPKTWEVDSGSLVGHWPLDEGPGAGSSKDATGNGHDASFVNGPTWATGSSCKYGNCVSLNGLNSYLTMPDAPGLEFAGGGMTVEPGCT